MTAALANGVDTQAQQDALLQPSGFDRVAWTQIANIFTVITAETMSGRPPKLKFGVS